MQIEASAPRLVPPIPVDPSKIGSQHRLNPTNLTSSYAAPSLRPKSPALERRLSPSLDASNRSATEYFPLTSPTPASKGDGNGWARSLSRIVGAGTSHRSASAGALDSSTALGITPAGFTDSPAYWISLYFVFNLGLTLLNWKTMRNFPFPYTLTALQALSGFAGCHIALERGAFIPARLITQDTMIVAAFSCLYTINISVSSLSMGLVSLPFHQVVRASTPLFAILVSVPLLGTKPGPLKILSLLPVVVGVIFATYGDYSFTTLGLILTLFGTFLAALKTVITNMIQTRSNGRLKLHPLDLLMRMSPLAFIQRVVYGWWSGELGKVHRYGATQMTRSQAIALLVNGIMAFGLNIVSFSANRKTSPLTMTVAANCKQVLTIIFAIFLFDNKTINTVNAIGITLTLIGGAWYGWIEYQEGEKRRAGKARGGV